METLPAFGLTMNHSIPARCGPLSGLRDVSRAPHSLPFAYITCCIRVSFESGLEITSLCAGSAPKRSLQQPVCPLNSSVVVSLIQSPCAAFGVPAALATVPDPGCCCLGGTPYCPTVNIRLDRLSAGDAEFNEAVFVNVQTMS